MKKTRKNTKNNKKIFLKWLHKSRKDNFKMKYGGTIPPSDSQEVVLKKTPTDVTSIASQFKKKSFQPSKKLFYGSIIATGAVDLLLKFTGSKAALAWAAGIGISSIGIYSGGAGLVGVAILTAIYFKIKKKYTSYYKLLIVMDSLMLLLQKLDNIVRLAVKISIQYDFIIDTKDINNFLMLIFAKFDEILDKEDLEDIEKEITEKIKNNEHFNMPEIADSIAPVQLEPTEAIIPEESDTLLESTPESPLLAPPETVTPLIPGKKGFFKRTAQTIRQTLGDAGSYVKKTVKQKFKKVTSFGKIIMFDADKWSDELNEYVTQLSIAFSILLGELNITLNIRQIDLITDGSNSSNQEMIELKKKNREVKESEEFANLLISSLIYKSLQLYNIFKQCIDPSVSNEQLRLPSTCKTPQEKQELSKYIAQAEEERYRMKVILFAKSKGTNDPLFSFYSEDFAKNSKAQQKLNELRGIVEKNSMEIIDLDKAYQFTKDLHNFNEGKMSGKYKVTGRKLKEGDKVARYRGEDFDRTSFIEKKVDPTTVPGDKPDPYGLL